MVASLPTSENGGIGIRSAVQLAPSAYLVFGAGCAGLVSSILPPWLQDTPNPWLSLAKARDITKHPLPSPTAIANRHGTLQDLKAYSLLESSSDHNTCACLLAGNGAERLWCQGVTCPDTLAPFHEHPETREAEAVAAQEECEVCPPECQSPLCPHSN